MAWELFLWLFTFFSVVGLLAIAVYQFICLADLESDHTNPYDSSAQINACVIPEFLIQGTLSAVFLLTWHWFLFLISVPITYYHIRLYMDKKHLVDVTEIFRSLEGEKKYRLVKLGFYMVLFFIVIYSLVATSVTMAMMEDEDYGARVRFGEMQEMKNIDSSPALSKSVYSYSSSSSSAPSSNFTFEADSLPIDLPRNWYVFQTEVIAKKFEDLLPKYNASVVCLQQVFDEVNLLQEENLNLKAQTIDLEFLMAATEKEILSFAGDILSDFRPIPAAVNQIPGEKKTTDVAVPKIISVRSKTVSSMNNIIKNQAIVADSNSTNAPANTGSKPPHRLRLVAKSAKDSEEAEEIELEVYNQGMTKTELCNKWEETGECPYGERCQFAHGVQELRPVIRHPKYKTAICRMITSGGTCPYGHRCHFRHSLNPNEEKQVVL